VVVADPRDEIDEDEDNNARAVLVDSEALSSGPAGRVTPSGDLTVGGARMTARSTPRHRRGERSAGDAVHVAAGRRRS
jgi:hypothetical protein